MKLPHSPLGPLSRAPEDDIDESDVAVGGEAHAAAGATAVAVAMKRAVEQMGPLRTARTLLRLNQTDGFDCQGCAWPDPEHRHTAEFCENGAKAVTEEATLRRVSPSTRSPIWRGVRSTGSVSRAGSPSRWCGVPAAPTTSRSAGTTRSR